MFDHVKFGVSDFALSKAFFLNALAPLGVKIVAEGEPGYGVELCPDRDCACFKPTKSRRTYTWHLSQAAVSRSMRSTTPR